MIIHRKKFYAISAQGRGGVSLQIGTTKNGFDKLGDILEYLKKKTNHEIATITITDLWEKRTETYQVKNNRLFKL